MRVVISREEEARLIGVLLDHLAKRFDEGRGVKPTDLVEVDGREVEADDLLRAIRLHEPLEE